MQPELLLFDIGNTCIKVGLADSRGVMTSYNLRTDPAQTSDSLGLTLLELLRHAGAEPRFTACVASSVVPGFDPLLREAVQRYLGCPLWMVPQDMPMARNKEDKQPLCPLEYGLDIFSGKWKTRIICLLGASGTLRYKEIRENLDGLTDAVLAATLRDMVNDRIVDRRQYNEIPPRVEYSLSEKGASAHKILRSICCWAVRYCPLPEESLPPCKKVGGCPL